MREAKTVYVILAIFLLVPWLVYNIKVYIGSKKNKKRFSAGRILSLALVSAFMITAVYSHFRFTIGYQAPLVAERAGEVFTLLVEGKVNHTEYMAKMEKQRLSSPVMTAVSDEKLEQAGFLNKHYSISLSERVYEMEDGSSVVYLMHTDGQASLYSLIGLRLSDYSWKVEFHDVLTRDEFDDLNKEMKIKFYPVES